MKGVPKTVRLSRQEEEVLLLSMSGLGDREVGEAMGLGTETVRTYWKRIRKKLDGGTRAEIIAQLSQRGVRAELDAILVENDLLIKEIARRKQAEARLLYQLDLVRTITDGAADAIFLLDAAGRVTFASPASKPMFGWTPEELIGNVFHDVMHHRHPDGREYPAGDCPLFLALGSHEAVRSHEDMFFHRDGRQVPISASVSPISDGGQQAGAVLIVRDITYQKAAERALHSSELRYHSLFESTLNPILLIDDALRVLDGNPAAVRIFGFDRERLLGAGLDQTIFEGNRKVLDKALAAVRELGSWEGTLSVRNAASQEVRCYMLAQPDRGSSPTCVWITLRPEPEPVH